MKRSHNVYKPSQTEIQQACEEIQNSWSSADRNRRKVKRGEPWSPPIINITETINRDAKRIIQEDR